MTDEEEIKHILSILEEFNKTYDINNRTFVRDNKIIVIENGVEKILKTTTPKTLIDKTIWELN